MGARCNDFLSSFAVSHPEGGGFRASFAVSHPEGVGFRASVTSRWGTPMLDLSPPTSEGTSFDSPIESLSSGTPFMTVFLSENPVSIDTDLVTSPHPESGIFNSLLPMSAGIFEMRWDPQSGSSIHPRSLLRFTSWGRFQWDCSRLPPRA